MILEETKQSYQANQANLGTPLSCINFVLES